MERVHMHLLSYLGCKIQASWFHVINKNSQGTDGRHVFRDLVNNKELC